MFFIQHLLYTAPYRFVLAGFVIVVIFRLIKRRWIALGVLFGVGVFCWMRFVEPFWIRTVQTNLTVGFQAKIVLIADLHLGQNKDQHFLKQVVDRINLIPDVDVVLIAGDFMMEPTLAEVPILYTPLADIRYPTYAVFGNHDIEKPGPPWRKQLQEALQKANVPILNNTSIVLSGGIRLVGLGDNWGREDDVKVLDSYATGDHIIVLTHNPDTVLNYTNTKADLTLAGHTHCGQVKIPWLWTKVVPVSGPYLCGWYQTPFTQVFVTAGIGETSIPLRLFNPPTIDVLILN